MTWELLRELGQRFAVATVVGAIGALAGDQFTLPFGKQSFPFFYAPMGALAGFALGNLAAERLKTSPGGKVAAVILSFLVVGVTAAIGYETLLETNLVPSVWVLTQLIGEFIIAFVCFFFLVRMAGLALDRRGP